MANMSIERLSMHKNPSTQEMTAYVSGPFEGLMVQDALTIIAVFAAQLDPMDCVTEIERLELILNKLEIFKSVSADTRTRIYRFANALRHTDPKEALSHASRVINRFGAAKEAFDVAAEVTMINGLLTDEKEENIRSISSLLTTPET
jgi:hypothetical protein